MSKSYLTKNISLLRYLIGLWLLGSVAWMPMYYGVKKYYMISQIAGVWLVGLLFLFVTVFASATLISFFTSIFPYKSWSFDKKFYRFFLIIALILLPLSAAYMTYYSPIEIAELLTK
jgi:hypothetical protein